MKEVWFQGAKDRDRVKQDIALAQKAFERLAVILEGRTKGVLSGSYDKPNWPFYRADLDGYNRALTEVLELIKD